MKSILLKRKTFLIVGLIIGFIGGFTCLIYANNYNSSEISYDTSVSGAVQANVKDALDFLYDKIKSEAAFECPENMVCLSIVTMSVTGPGSVDKGTVYVGLNESNTFTVTPNEGYTLHSISCNNGYTLSSFSTETGNVALNPQTITITNTGITTETTCQIKFDSNEMPVTSTKLGIPGPGAKGYDDCGRENEGCVCYYINKYVKGYDPSSNRGEAFSYNRHTGCTFKSYDCHYPGGTSFDCANLRWHDKANFWYDYIATSYAACSGVITCET